ncbi:MAG: hypothetical protein ACKOWI_01385 [Rhodoluna sp.]
MTPKTGWLEATISIWTLAALATFAVMFITRMGVQDLKFLSTPFFLGIYLLAGMAYGLLSSLLFKVANLVLGNRLTMPRTNSFKSPRMVAVLGSLLLVNTVGLSVLGGASYFQEPIIYLASFVFSAIALFLLVRSFHNLSGKASQRAAAIESRSLGLFVLAWLIGVVAASAYGQAEFVSPAANGTNVWLMTLALLCAVCSPFGVILGVIFFKLQSCLENLATTISSKRTRSLVYVFGSVVQVLMGCLVLAFVSEKLQHFTALGLLVNVLIAAGAWAVTALCRRFPTEGTDSVQVPKIGVFDIE